MASNYNDPQAPKTFEDAAKKIALNAFMACVLSLVIYISVLFVFRSIGNPKIIGYTEFEIIVDDDGNAIDEVGTTYYFEDGEEAVIPESDDTHYYNKIYTNDAFPEVLSQILTVLVFTLMIYTVAWGFGDRRRNEVAFGRATRNKLEGAKLGVYSSVVSILAYILMLIAKLGVSIRFAMPIFGLVNSCFLPLFNAFVSNKHGTYGLTAVIGNAPDDLSWVGLSVMLLPILYKVLVCFVAYELGYKGISIKEKIIYKNNK